MGIINIEQMCLSPTGTCVISLHWLKCWNWYRFAAGLKKMGLIKRPDDVAVLEHKRCFRASFGLALQSGDMYNPGDKIPDTHRHPSPCSQNVMAVMGQGPMYLPVFLHL